MKQVTDVIIHGHFYQPPRENPWTLKIDRQDSAKPNHDWNERINAQCYAPNTASRVLDNRGRIKEIINNYEYISFNFGPTLINWIKEYAPTTFDLIIEADVNSKARNNNHGNAIAQVYNHMIMPLCNEYDMHTQIEWGLRDFRHNFHRDSEGIWLAETAINYETVSALIKFGIKYVILSPFQAAKIKQIQSDHWEDVSSGSINPRKAYRIFTKEGHIDAFFYDHPLATAISFEHLLRNSESLKDRIIQAASHHHNEMINVATDGESYGHHEPFGDMCLAHMIYQNNTHNGPFNFTNYGAYLEKHPPQFEVRLKAGNNGLGTSWSCSHGVGRWLEDCGCKTGGAENWTQKWRGPLRGAFDYIRDNFLTIYQKKTAPLLNDPMKARNDYIDILLNQNTKAYDDFFNKHQKKELSKEEKTLILRLMEAQKYAMFMYTSCAWFFTELSGIETVQNLKYSAKALEYMKPFINKEVENVFLDKLAAAPSNIQEFLNGKWLYLNFVAPYTLSEECIVHQIALDTYFHEQYTPDKKTLYFYKYTISSYNCINRNDYKICRGEISLTNTILDINNTYAFYIFTKGATEIKNCVKKLHDGTFTEYANTLIEKYKDEKLLEVIDDLFAHHFTLDDLHHEWKEKIVKTIFKTQFSKLHEERAKALPECINIIHFYNTLHLGIPREEKALLESILSEAINQHMKLIYENNYNIDYELLEEIIKSARFGHFENIIEPLNDLFEDVIENFISEYLTTSDNKNYQVIITFIDFINKLNIALYRVHIETMLFKFLKENFELYYLRIKSNNDQNALVFIKSVITLAEKLNIRTDEYVQQLKHFL
jgi:alpha-amylase/alpha-mannosidase (GH57 family)